ncbi:hypothetical protein VTP01DRAFT_4736 [Rhizomucor pusillus]|uniref:uncharacterized protein n=1 Tax=Rhizomucor pusillus TaxID=4840 RepID=UPI003741EB99
MISLQIPLLPSISSIAQGNRRHGHNDAGSRCETSYSVTSNDCSRCNHYIVLYDVDEERNALKTLFFCRETSIQRARRFNEVVLIDATYKTNDRGLPLVNIVGIGNSGQKVLTSFAIGCAFVSNERIESYDRLAQFLKAAVYPDTEPGLFITDNDASLVKALEKHFPDSQHILCQWHISKNFEKMSFENFSVEEGWIQRTRYAARRINGLAVWLVVCFLEQRQHNVSKEPMPQLKLL